ncbi:Aste57867_23767 [Aphanomyces stellatus]|uniref:Aste57867_23767 protein n=1 Tax=Aphanomyces stellatus TaxID=120398 RepID=A0A485LQ85_9STRA|nr:hypothetical protein As57867_023694 [Aphanomyces stellatus]VFU00412.1 Aste57867_23767 [Aphanomyces stellatus]
MPRSQAKAADAASTQPTSWLIQQMKANGKRTVQDLFRQIDIDGSGTIDADEFHRGLASQGMAASHIAQLFAWLDPHKSGVVNYQTFFDHYYDQLPPPPVVMSTAQVLEKVQTTLSAKRHRLHKLFHAFDEDKNGTIDHAEFHHCLASLGLSTDEIDCVVGLFDPDGNGAIDYSEFTAAVLPLENATELGGLNLAREKPHGVKAFPPPPSLVQPLMLHEDADGGNDEVAKLYHRMLDRLQLKHHDLRTAFRHFDSKRDGQFNFNSFQTCMGSIGSQVDDIRRVWVHLDPHETGFVPFHVFSQSKSPPRPSPPKPALLSPLVSAVPQVTKRTHVQDKVRLQMERNFKQVARGVGDLYRRCRPDVVGVFDKRVLIRQLQTDYQLTWDEATLFCAYGPDQMMEKDLLACLNASSTPPTDPTREPYKDAQRIVHVADTHGTALAQAFRQVSVDTRDHKIVYTKLSLPEVSDVLRHQFGHDVPPDRLEELMGTSDDITYSQLVRIAQCHVLNHETPGAMVPLAKTDFYGQPLGNRGAEDPSPHAKRHISDRAFLAHDMRIQDLPSPTKRSFPGPSTVAGLASGGFGVRCSIEPMADEPEPMPLPVAPRWPVKVVEAAHEKIGLGGGRKKMADLESQLHHDMKELILSPPPEDEIGPLAGVKIKRKSSVQLSESCPFATSEHTNQYKTPPRKFDRQGPFDSGRNY